MENRENILDDLSIEKAPDWLNVLLETEERESTLELKAYSEKFRMLKKQIYETKEEYSRLAKIMENDEWNEKEVLSEEELKTLAELIRAEFELTEYYQRMMFFRGCRLGYRFAQYAELLGGDKRNG